ncbi:glutamate racemase [Vulcanibacillus modesticaldus]|uniref:Glutamate racemase n=1 Tax=Vulcanibacillus modesticaldus TaxID=337097 RepID=A0A1D2YWG0_9BACI|nr:glutamate racemase [Vulcanibacillus modesticaldus]OEF99987.1 glutamate racemase [Vulcanibacillus modesticaldus]
MDRHQPIGILDSGVGGLTVVKEIFRQLPHEEVIYVGDTARCPYGSRPIDEVKQFTLEIVDFLLKYNVKMIVIACNTATSFALDAVKEKVKIPVVGVIRPGSLAAIKNTKTGKIGVIGTEGTILSGAYQKALNQINPNLTVTSLACPTLVPLVEDGSQSEETIKKVVKQALKPILNHDFDSLILGCTHYPIISEYIQEVVGNEVMLLSSAEETAREVSMILHYQDLLASHINKPSHRFFTTGDKKHFKQIGEKWLQQEINVEHIDL